MLFLIAPAISAWAWQYRADEPRNDINSSGVIIPKTLPVEIIVSDDTPKWVLVPIDPE